MFQLAMHIIRSFARCYQKRTQRRKDLGTVSLGSSSEYRGHL